MTTVTTTTSIELDGAPPIPGLRLRAFRAPDDYRRLAELVSASNRLDDIPWMPTESLFRIEMEGSSGLDPAQDVVLAEVGGEVVAATGVERVVRAGQPTYEIWGNVAPEYRRRGLGSWLLPWTLSRAATRTAAEDAGLEPTLASHTEETEAGHRALLEGAGFTVVRHFFLMKRELSEPIPEAPLPEGIEIRPVTPEQHRQIFDAEREAFRDHWNSRELGDDAFANTFAHEELDTGLWVVAWDGGQVAGVVQNWIWASENEGLGVSRGWLEHISVRRPWRRRGLARAITAESLRRFREKGLAQGMLGVDSENPTGALGLYEGLGFEVMQRSFAYRRAIAG
jgi:mycothiol synthase